ncbi:cache domain-containing sensor histidine kinase [Paenibacillus typhae]|uniref:Two-component system, sensor histidine kinase YesM n=1 Tax=Paenibacillus typhae TaxID=1174501 RepID=A0A1G8JKJ0_9BACL|nr:histidine kinase [Paenibacillus typhae]SDI31611.1 two-component system, sensor histidine kinase YesM [Paenibacillus typhae]
MIVFALLIATLLSFFSYELISYYQRKTTIQATEFNLQLVSHIIEQDLLNLSVLAMTSSTNSPTNTLLADYFESPDAKARDALDVFSSMQEDFQINRSYNYVRRLIVTDNKGKFLQLDNSVSISTPLTIHNIGQITGLNNETTEEFDQVIKDPLSTAYGIPFILPIYGDRASRIGTVYLLVNTSVITDKLKGYTLPEDSRLLLTLGTNHYEIIGDKIQPVTTPYHPVAYTQDEPVGPMTRLSEISLEGEERTLAVSYVVRSGVELTQTIAGNQFAPKANIWIPIMFGVCLLVLVLSGIITLYLTRTISLPVEKLKKRIDKIAQGNFLLDRNIEWNSELGDVGRGINRLSQDIIALMDSRLADEKQKQELEYRMLQNQINPHFLYNTLNSIKWMATIQNATGIAEMTTSLSRLLRSIAKDNRRLLPLRDELNLLEDYFLIQKYRYGSTVTMVQSIADEELLGGLIPRFTLQPLVENAIFHGIEPKGRGDILITVAKSGFGDILITVEDNGIGMEEEQITHILSKPEEGSKGLFENVGLRSVNERLQLAFGEPYGLSIESKPGQYTQMKLLIPFQLKE